MAATAIVGMARRVRRGAVVGACVVAVAMPCCARSSRRCRRHTRRDSAHPPQPPSAAAATPTHAISPAACASSRFWRRPQRHAQRSLRLDWLAGCVLHDGCSRRAWLQAATAPKALGGLFGRPREQRTRSLRAAPMRRQKPRSPRSTRANRRRCRRRADARSLERRGHRAAVERGARRKVRGNHKDPPNPAAAMRDAGTAGRLLDEMELACCWLLHRRRATSCRSRASSSPRGRRRY